MDKVKAVIEAGWVQRLHTTPHHRPHTVAHHSWGMTAMLLMLHPDPSKALISATVFHDVAERWTGDMPSPMKWWINPVAGTAIAETEAEILIKMGLAWRLSPEETTWLKALDILELFIYAKDELHLGNRHFQEVHDVCHELIHGDTTPVEILDWLRTPPHPIRTSDTAFNEVQP